MLAILTGVTFKLILIIKSVQYYENTIAFSLLLFQV